MIIDCGAIVKKLDTELIDACSVLSKNTSPPKLCEILATSNQAVLSYAETKRRKAEGLGIIYESIICDQSKSTSDVIEVIQRLNEDSSVNGILVGLPTFSHVDSEMLVNAINHKKDIDGLGVKNSNLILSNQEHLGIAPATPSAALHIIESLLTLSGKNVCVIGRGRTVGRPLIQMLINRDATVTVCHSRTPLSAIEDAVKQSDIIITAIGCPGRVKSEWFSADQVAIDCGISFINNITTGDLDSAALSARGVIVSPVPKGVGAVTNSMIFSNLLKAIRL
ncbi:bifunctional 5,10-methylenetetrahydrofolate dehydrogenase/5,10-methenyltetrahydrofolate cyclohydrolase [Iodobacter sp.]|uniref:bifunctional 5,10-methylenetetrahydrofolate dehydrogenase/5,10-methenyltetrahydrofolate cyclohydrolase n=1 Tax=Iodobacter sp. TaxID=1915058 RepID=UPI0025D00F53|nr:bifunctional 5,10-methylenetetrahydrofolate dehydrogenase/5,10-methenyltetrahydrofolate cyclohydrolase [Iodobacter sp.]